MNKVQFNLHIPLGALESSRNKRYSPGDISIAANGRVSRQTVHALLNKRVTRIEMDTLSALLDFFSAEGMPITIDQLFTVQEEGSQAENLDS